MCFYIPVLFNYQRTNINLKKKNHINIVRNFYVL